MTDPSGADEVVRRLRQRVDSPDQDCRTAADLLTAQAARIAELEGDVADLDMNVEAAAELILAGSAREVAAGAEAQKLRARVSELEVQLGDTDDALKDTWAKHGGTEIALGQWRARAEAAEAEDLALRAEAQKLRAEVGILRSVRDELVSQRDEAVGLLRVLSHGTYLERGAATTRVQTILAKHGGGA